MVANTRHSGRGGEDLHTLRQAAHANSTPLDTEHDLDPLLDRIGDARYVLLGEASHGTSEFYSWRTRISQRLIVEKGFSFIAVEGDWPDCYRVNRYVKTYPDSGPTAYDVLHAFERWPTWMWANREVVHLAEWLRGRNENLPREEQAGFYGLDVYSLWESMEAVVNYLKRTDSRAVAAVRRAYACFEPYGRDEHRYARATAMVNASCEDKVVSVLTELRRKVPAYPGDPEAAFDAEQNALTVVNAERYYRTMVHADADSWNLRDTHMADTLDRLMAFHRSQRDAPKAIVWAHNTHIGDARATDMAAAGMTNLGQLARERHGRDKVALVGFSTYRGSVIAARAWGERMERMPVPAAMEGSWDDILTTPPSGRGMSDGPRTVAADTGALRARLLMTGSIADFPGFLTARGQRAIGVVYRPRFERLGNYVPTILPERYDAMLSFQDTEALHPLHIEHVDLAEVPETYPSGV